MVSKKRNRKKNRFRIPHSLKALPQKAQYSIPTNPPRMYDVHPYFSFRFYDHDNKKFHIEKFSHSELRRVFKELKKLSQYKWGEIFNKFRGYYHAHEITWHETEIKKGFVHLPVDLQSKAAYQFKVFKECRVYGFFNHHNVFKIVWIDRIHQAYKNSRYA